MYTIALYTIILHILHSLYEFARFIHNIYTYIVSFLSSSSTCDNDVTLQIRSLKKKPHHLVFMLGNEEPSFKDLANIVLWSTAAGIPIISFYDHIGLLKQTISQFYKVLAEKNIKFTSSNNLKHQNGHKNGFSNSSHSIQINVFTLQDGQNSVAEVAKECVTNNISNDELTIEYVDKQLRRKIGELPDPELALYCGRICSTYGLLPWQIRLTEFIDVTSHRGICFSEFILALKRYEKSEQRYGK